MASTYIIYSQSIDTFYIGSCLDFSNRLKEHNSGLKMKAFTHRAIDWEVYFLIEELSYSDARFLESFIKRMRNRTFYSKLKLDPTIAKDILKKNNR